MGYRIVYGPEQPSGRGKGSGLRLRTMTAAFFLLGCILTRTLWPAGTQLLREMLLPGTPTAAEQAFLDMMEDLRCGVPVGESVTVFCRTVVEHGTDSGS